MITFIALIVSIIGALNWLVIGIFDFNALGWLFGTNLAIVSRIIYTIVGLSGVWLIGYMIKRGRTIIYDEKNTSGS